LGPPCADPWHAAKGGLRIAVRVQPKASAERIDGVQRDAAGEAWLRLRVTAPADRGAANAAVLRLLARVLGLPPGDLALVAGAQARNKHILASGDAAVLARRLAALLEEQRA